MLTFAAALVVIAGGVALFKPVPEPSTGPAATQQKAPAGTSPAPAATVPRVAAPPEFVPPLELQAWSWSQTEGGGYVEVVGRVRNMTGSPLDRVQAVVSFYDRGGQFITTDSAMLEYQPVMPGQASPFKVMARYNPAMNKAAIEFKEMFGATIAHRTKPKPTPTPRPAPRPIPKTLGPLLEEIRAAEPAERGRLLDALVKYRGPEAREAIRKAMNNPSYADCAQQLADVLAQIPIE